MSIAKRAGVSAVALAVFSVGSVHAAAVAIPTQFDKTASTLTLTQTEDTSVVQPTSFVVAVPGASVPAVTPATFQLNHTFTASTGSGNSSTLADLGAYEITTPLTLGVALKPGSGVSQTNVPGKAFTGASVSELAISATWDIGSSGFPTFGHIPGISYQYPVGGTIGIGGKDEVKINLTFTDPSVSDNAIGTISVDKVFSNNGASPLPFVSNIVGTILINNGVALPANSELDLNGTIDFMSTNDESPSDLSLTDEGDIGSIDASVETAIPEPASLAIGAVCAGGLLARRRRA